MKACLFTRENAKAQELEKINNNPALQGKTRIEMGLKPFNGTEINSNIGGLNLTIQKGYLAALLGITSSGRIISLYGKNGNKSLCNSV
jgi:hypothetical protein